MNEDALRALVRDAIARIEGTTAVNLSNASAGRAVNAFQPLSLRSDPSHYQYTLPPSDGPCLIEPGVACSHCGYCQSHGY